MLIVGLLARFTDLITLASPWDRLEEPWVLAAIGVLAAVDFVGDKVPAVDHAFHAVGAVLAPVMGAVVAVAVAKGSGASAPVVAATGLALAGWMHGARAAVRPVSTVTTGGLGNPVLSLAEDLVSGALSLGAVIVPVVAFAAALVIVAGIGLVLWQVIRRRRERSARVAR